MAAHLIFFLLLPFVHAQFIQRYNTVNGVPHWRRQIGNNFVNLPVAQPEYPVYLEYNCRAMPAICHNVRSWINDPLRNSWTGRAGTWVFTYDMQAGVKKAYSQGTKSRKEKTNRDHRRKLACDDPWRISKHVCPEPGQPTVMGKNGAWPHTALETKDRKAPKEIEAIRINGQITERSQRIYSCDEFPPASWVEGGVGLPNNVPPEGNNGAGTTYCAPFGSGCGGGTRVSSEQDWQGSSHTKLNNRLVSQMDGKYRKDNGHDQKKVTENKYPMQDDEVVQFHLRLANTNDNVAVRVYYKDYTKKEADTISPMDMFKRDIHVDFPSNLTFYERAMLGEQMTPQDMAHYGYVSDTIEHVDFTQLVVRYANGSVELDDGTMLSASEYESLRDSLDNPETSPQPRSLHDNSTSEPVPSWNISSSDVDQNLTSYKLETHQEPNGDAIDIIGLSEQYIRAQIWGSNATTGGTNHTTNNTHHQVARHPHGEHRHSHSRGHSHGHTSPRRTYSLDSRAVDGPIQCGEGNPCKDGACCNKDGKCGFKEAQCGANCISNCDAKAMCGIDSKDGATKCGLNLCCSYYGWCGTETVHCLDPEPQYAKTPCQQGYGACAITPKPSCGTGSGTSGGRRVGYYQGWNTRERSCDKVRPSQINTKGLTHLYYAFVFFHPTTFEIMPMNDADIPLYKEFTDLKTNKLQTWVAIGGWSFNEPESPTATAFSDMVSTAANRAAFITSLISFMDTYGFQGADIDWEYPAEVKRGGRPEDTDNLVTLMKEMRAAFGHRYGLSIVLAPDYWYLRGFKPAAMQQYVDHMGFMSYDLHGPWDTDVKTLGSLIRPQTDITEIDKGLTPLWFDGVDPSKINMGIAYYGRSYKLADPGCSKMGCSFVPKQGGAPGKCTNSAGVMSNREIRQLIEDDGITPILNETAMIKYFTYGGGDSWIGYDDEETYAMKEAFANDRCLGGIMIWSIDFDADMGGVGNETADGLVWIDPEIWEQPTPTVQCFFPCTMVLPPYPADKASTIDYPRLPVTTNGKVAGTLTFAPLTVTEYALSMMTIAGGDRRRQEPVITTRPELSTTTNWPVKYWTDQNANFYSTRASKPALNFPSSDISLPQYASLHVVNGPPSPTVSQCAFPAHICEPKQTGDNKDILNLRLTRGAVAKGPASLEDIFLHILPDEIIDIDESDVCLPDSDDNNEEENDPDEESPGDDPGEETGGAEPPDVVVPPPVELPPWLLGGFLPLFFPGHPWSNNTATATVPFETPMSAGPTATMPFEPAVPIPTVSVDFSQDKKPSCYNSGLKANRKDLVDAIDALCRYYDQALFELNTRTLPAGLYQIDRNFKADGQEYTDYVTTFEIMDFCKWENFSFDDCGRELRKIVDGCNTKGENGKQGGTMKTGDCVKWRVDPNKEVYHAPKS